MTVEQGKINEVAMLSTIQCTQSNPLLSLANDRSSHRRFGAANSLVVASISFEIDDNPNVRYWLYEIPLMSIKF